MILAMSSAVGHDQIPTNTSKMIVGARSKLHKSRQSGRQNFVAWSLSMIEL